MMVLSYSERISMIRSAVLIQSTRVTDRQTDGRTDGTEVAYTALSRASRGKYYGDCGDLSLQRVGRAYENLDNSAFYG